MVSGFSIFNVCLVLLTGFVSATFVSAYVHADFLLHEFDRYRSLASSDIGVQHLSAFLLVFGVVLNAVLFLSAWRVTVKNVWKWLLVLFLSFLLCIIVVALCVNLFAGMPFVQTFDQCLFASCCGMLWVAGTAWGLGYKGICVIINIYL